MTPDRKMPTETKLVTLQPALPAASDPLPAASDPLPVSPADELV
jgi:hypothetical protein